MESTNTNNKTSNENLKYRKFPFIPILSEKIEKHCQILDPNIKFGVKPLNILKNKIFTKTKDKIKLPKKGFIYQIPCGGNKQKNEDCNIVYVGETGRSHDNPYTGKLGDRKKEHIYDFKKAKEQMSKINDERTILYSSLRTRNKSKQLEDLKLEHSEEDMDRHWKTALLDHAMKSDHEFNYNQMNPVHFESDRKRRLMLESLYIYNNHQNACNFKQDTMNMNVQAKQIVNAYSYLKSKK